MAELSSHKHLPKARKAGVVLKAGDVAGLKVPLLTVEGYVRNKGKARAGRALQAHGMRLAQSEDGKTLILGDNDVVVGEIRGSVVRVAAGIAAGADPAAYRPDARARAVLRGVKMTEDMLVAAGGAFDLAEVQALFRGVSRQAIDKRVQDGSLLAVPGPGGSRVYPTFQFQTDGSLMPGLKQVQAALPSRSPWAVLAFLMTPHADLGPRETPRRPVDLLREGDLALVLLAAQGIGVQGS